MPRRPRIHLDGVPLHIVQRGHNREPCFFGEEDYQSYLYWLGGRKLSPAHHRPGRRYVQYIDTTYRRTGILWDSRYKSSLIQAETYLLACQRYIELNPCAPQ